MRTSSGAERGWRGQTGLLLGIGLLATLWFFWTAGLPSFGYFSPTPPGYYGAQTAGFIQGHTHVAITPAPGLLALSDPYDPVANAPYRVHDMTLWQGKYYLYYGVSPVLIFFLPIFLLTGTYPTEVAAVASLCSIGVVTALLLLGAVRRRYFPAAPLWTLVAGALVVVFASPVTTLTEAVQFYQVPIAGAFALHMLMLAAIYRSLSSRRSSWVWLAMASGLFGLSIGARPNYLLSGFALVVPWIVLIRRRGREWRRTEFFRTGVAAFGPALVAGVALLFYNWVRFGSASEFGMKYTLGGERIPDVKLMGFENIVPHLGHYLTQAGNWSRYFPFFSAPTGVPYGALRYAPWLLLIPAMMLVRGTGGTRGQVAVGWTIAVASLANLALLTCFFGLTDRYSPDYVPAALLLAGMGALALGERLRRFRPAAWMGGALAVITIFFGVAVWMKRFPQPERLLSIARVANYPTHGWERWRDQIPGGLKMELELPSTLVGVTEPILHTGIAGDQRNWLQIEYLPERRAKLSFFHAGLGLVPGKEFEIPADGRVSLDVEAGALLAPKAHPMFADWSDGEYLAARRKLLVKVNGVPVIQTALECYESTASDLLIGRMGRGASGIKDEFSGRVAAVKRLPVPRPTLARVDATNRMPLELKLRFPADRASGREPLVVTGNEKEFDILFVEYAGIGKVSFGLYHHGDEPIVSPILAIDPTELYTLQLWMGSLAPPVPGVQSDADDLPMSRRLTLVLNGEAVVNRKQVFYPAEPTSVVLGENRLVDDMVKPTFLGQIEAVKTIGFDQLPDPGLLQQYGAVDLTVVFARGAQGASEPLVVTGVPGAGNFLYVRYLEGGKMVFGFDHWGVGGLAGEPIEVDTWKPHRLRLTMGSLYPVGEDVGEWRRRVQIKLDDTVVLEGEYATHPSARTQIRIGENVIGGSTCGPRFSGQIQKIERPARPVPDP